MIYRFVTKLFVPCNKGSSNLSDAEIDQMSAEYRGFFRKQEEISERCNGLDKEVFRLNNQREKLNESAEQQTNYLWEEYELTPHAAAELRNSEYEDPLALKKLIAAVKDEIRKLGTVNVNAIEEYKEVSERYTFLKGQHDDLVEAEQTLLGIIEDLDSGMRKQFMEKFAEIQKEFNASFKHTELIAVIAAAIAASTGTSTSDFVVRSINRR